MGMKKIGILGASGYTGADAVRLLARHPNAEITALTACMRKLIVILNTMIARRQKWDANRYKVNDPARLPPSACPA